MRLGLGDPCRLVGLTKVDIENGGANPSNTSWCLPNTTPSSIVWSNIEYKGNSVNDYYPGANVTIGNNTLFEPAAGARNRITGNVNVVKVTGGNWRQTKRRYWFSIGDITYSHTPSSDERSTAYPIRCVPQ